MPDDGQGGNTWLAYAAMTVVCWGVYGVLLHTGHLEMNDAEHGRNKAFLWVGIAYFLVAVLAPAGLLMAQGATWTMTTKGVAWSLAAGILGAVGALGALLALHKSGNPAAVMSIVFAGAPIVNAAVALALHPPAGGLSSLKWQFTVGILLAALGGTMVTKYKPGPGKPPVEQASKE